MASAAASSPVAAPAASAVTIGHASAVPPPSSDPDEAAEPDEAIAPLAKRAGKSNEADGAENTSPTVKEGGRRTRQRGYQWRFSHLLLILILIILLPMM